MWKRFRPSYIRAFNDAKDCAGKKMLNDKTIDTDDYVEASEFRYLAVYLCVYCAMFDAFAMIDGNSEGITADDDRRMDITEWKRSYSKIAGHGFVAFKSLENSTDARLEAVFREMDAAGKGKVPLLEFCAFVKRKEQEAGTTIGKLLSAGDDHNRDAGFRRQKSQKRWKKARRSVTMLTLAIQNYVGEDDDDVIEELVKRALQEKSMDRELERWLGSALIFDTMTGHGCNAQDESDGCNAQDESDGLLNYEEYRFFHARLVAGFNKRSTMEGSTEALISEEEEAKAVEDDWRRDSKGDGTVDPHDFKYSICELAATWCIPENDEEPGPDFTEFLQQLHPLVFGTDPMVVVDEYLVEKYKEFQQDQAFLDYAHDTYGEKDESADAFAERTKVIIEHSPVSKADDVTGWFGEAPQTVTDCVLDYWAHEPKENKLKEKKETLEAHEVEQQVQEKAEARAKTEGGCSMLAAVWSRKWRKGQSGQTEKRLGKWTKANHFGCIKAWNTALVTISEDNQDEEYAAHGQSQINRQQLPNKPKAEAHSINNILSRNLSHVFSFAHLILQLLLPCHSSSELTLVQSPQPQSLSDLQYPRSSPIR
jgi:hypothetical protein